MKHLGWRAMLAIGLIASSILIFIANYLIFHNTEEELFLLVEELGFIPIEVLVVTLIIDQLLQKREKRSRLEKMNMVIGAFFSDVGLEVLRLIVSLDKNIDNIRNSLRIGEDWEETDFTAAKESLRSYMPSLSFSPLDFEKLKVLLGAKKDFVLRLLENPNLLEHESFTDLLWAMSHVGEELAARSDLRGLGKEDMSHLENDVKRAYTLVMHEWLDYMKHLKTRYPYLYSLSVRTNPFNPNAKAEISS
ncbi:MAG: hypothetical protein QXE18_00175 [Thermoplasmata archaeon]